MGYRRRRDSRPGRAPPRASRRRHRGHRGPRVLVGVRRGSPRLPAGIGRRRPGGVRGATAASRSRSTSPPPTAGPGPSARRSGSTSASATRTPTSTRSCRRCRPRCPPGARPGRRPAPGLSRDPGPAQRRSHEIAHAVMHRPARPSRWPSRPAGRTPRTGPRGGRLRLRRADPRPGRVVEAAGQAGAAAPAQAFTGRPARYRAGGRLQHLPDLERLPGPVRLPGHRQRRAGQAGRAAVLPLAHHRRGGPRGAGRGRLRPIWSPGRRARRTRAGATLAVRPEIRLIDYTGSTAFGDWLEANARQAVVYTEKAGVNTVVDRLHRRLPGHALQPGVLALAVQRPDVHDAPEPVGARATASRPTRATSRSTRSRRTWRRRSTGCSATRRGRPRSWARSWAPNVLGRIEEAEPHGDVVLASQAIEHAEFPGPAADAALVALTTSTDERVHPRVLRPDRASWSATGATDQGLESAADHARARGADGGLYSTDPGVMSGPRRSRSTAAWRCRST